MYVKVEGWSSRYQGQVMWTVDSEQSEESLLGSLQVRIQYSQLDGAKLR